MVRSFGGSAIICASKRFYVPEDPLQNATKFIAAHTKHRIALGCIGYLVDMGVAWICLIV